MPYYYRSCLVGPALLGALLLPGCGGDSADLNKAKAALETSLEKWKTGGTWQQLKDQAIDITDPDWSAGYRLLDFNVKDVSTQPQQGSRVVVVLKLQNRAGKQTSKEVGYEVNIKDRVNIGRDPFHIAQ